LGQRPHSFWLRVKIKPVRELGESATSLGKILRISQPAVSMSVRRGEEIVKEMGVELLAEA
jgi:predicted transcriptional regulator